MNTHSTWYSIINFLCSSTDLWLTFSILQQILYTFVCVYIYIYIPCAEVSGREKQEAWRQDEIIEAKSPVVK
jgi:hypothetical protein